jgi:dipeptidyl aminopeptidase/acylaminoacyl peptidase
VVVRQPAADPRVKRRARSPAASNPWPTRILVLCLTVFSVGDAARAVGAATGRRTLRPDDFYRAIDVSDPRVSPDGRWVAYVATANDRQSDEPRSAVWMVSWDGREQVQLTPAADGTAQPRWSPDGRYLAFVGKPPGADHAQLMLLDRRGGDARPLAEIAGDIADYAWSPDGARIVLAVESGDTAGRTAPIVIDALHFKDDDHGYLGTDRARHLYLVGLADRRVEPLTSDPVYDEDLPAWSPDGRRVAFVRTRGFGADSDGRMSIDVIDARPGATAREIARPYAPNNQSLAWSPDGTHVAYLQGLAPKYYAYMQDRLFTVPAAGGAGRALTDGLDRAVMSYAYTADGRGITIVVEDDRTEYPARVDLATGAIRRLAPAGPYVVSSVVQAGGHTALLLTRDDALAEVYALADGGLRKLTAQNDAFLGGLRLGSVEDIGFRDAAGAEIHGLLVEPPGFVRGRRYPMVLWIHGGPNGQDEHSLVLDGYQFEPQMFAAAGYVVLRVNYRGGSGRGIDFAKAIFADWGDKEVQDLLAGTRHLVESGIADPARLAIGGWSYGGILTDYTIASDGRFKAAISGAGSADQIAMYGSDEYALQYNHELGPPWVDPAAWIKVSYPFFHADRIHTPTLFLGGDKDFNVPVNGGEQMYQSLRTLGVPARLVVYPGQHHIFTRPSDLVDVAGRMLAWLGRHDPP